MEHLGIKIEKLFISKKSLIYFSCAKQSAQDIKVTDLRCCDQKARGGQNLIYLFIYLIIY